MTTNQIKLNSAENRQRVQTINGARYVHPCIGENQTIQRHAAIFLDPVETTAGESLPAGTIVSVISCGMYGHKKALGCTVWGDGRHVHIYC